jgi:hypothetical protein
VDHSWAQQSGGARGKVEDRRFDTHGRRASIKHKWDFLAEASPERLALGAASGKPQAAITASMTG